MFDYKHYVPILKAKDGEFKALAVTSDSTKEKMTPLLEIVKIPWDYKRETDSRSIEQHLQKVPKSVQKSWGSRIIFIDSPFLDGDLRMSDGILHHLVFLFNEFRSLGLNAVPVANLQNHPDYKNSIRSIVASDNRGFCLRLSNADFMNPNLKNLIDVDLAFYGLNPSEVHLIMDMKSINNAPDILPLSILTVINSRIPYLNKWKTFTLSGSAFPDNLAGVASNSISRIDRIEWVIWEALLMNGLKRLPSFGDYAISHPDMLDMNPLLMTMSASIRYTHDNYWVIAKGRSVKTQGFVQYHNLSSQLILLPEYAGNGYSWGDGYIDDCAARNVTCGNATTWRQVGNNHHFEKVNQQISMIP